MIKKTAKVIQFWKKSSATIFNYKVLETVLTLTSKRRNRYTNCLNACLLRNEQKFYIILKFWNSVIRNNPRAKNAWSKYKRTKEFVKVNLYVDTAITLYLQKNWTNFSWRKFKDLVDREQLKITNQILRS